MKQKSIIIILMTFVILYFNPLKSFSQIDLNKITNKAVDKVSKKKNDKNKDENQNSNSQTTDTKTTDGNQTDSKPSIIDEIAKEQQTLAAENKTVTENFSDGAFADIIEPAYLTFTNDYNIANANIISFSGEDAIYAKLNIGKSLYELMPKEDASGLQYYRVTIKVNTKEGGNESNVKLREKEFFKLPYSQKDLILAIVPEKAFFESIETNYKNANSIISGYNDILSRNFSSVISSVFKELSEGEHRVEIELEVTAKLQSDKYYKIKNIKGVFLLNVDEAAKLKFSENQTMLAELYNEYELKGSEAEKNEDLRQQEEKLNKMTIAERNQYLEQQKPVGSGFSDNSFSISISNENSGQTIYIIQTDLTTMSESITSVQPGSTANIQLYKSKRYRISAYNQNQSKDSAKTIGEVDKSSDGKTLTVR